MCGSPTGASSKGPTMADVEDTDLAESKPGGGARGTDRLVSFALPAINEAADCRDALAAIIRAVADGAITPGEATKIAKLVSDFAAIDNATEKQRRDREMQAGERKPLPTGGYLRVRRPTARGRT